MARFPFSAIWQVRGQAGRQKGQLARSEAADRLQRWPNTCWQAGQGGESPGKQDAWHRVVGRELAAPATLPGDHRVVASRRLTDIEGGEQPVRGDGGGELLDCVLAAGPAD